MEDVVASESNDLFRFSRSLVELETEFDKANFEQIVQLVWDAFEKNYSGYMKSFKEYIEFLESDEFQYATLLERIQSESIKAQDLRENFVRWLSKIPPSKSFTKTDLFNIIMSFTLSIEEYLGIQGIAAASFEVNYERNDKRQIKKFLDGVLAEIQDQYQKVSSKHQDLKAFILRI